MSPAGDSRLGRWSVLGSAAPFRGKKMIDVNKTQLGYEVSDTSKYIETDPAMPTSRVLDGSSDYGYAAEYIGHGTINDIPVIAVYLLDAADMTNDDEGSWDWDKALANGRIILDVDALTDAQWTQVQD